MMTNEAMKKLVVHPAKVTRNNQTRRQVRDTRSWYELVTWALRELNFDTINGEDGPQDTGELWNRLSKQMYAIRHKGCSRREWIATLAVLISSTYNDSTHWLYSPATGLGTCAATDAIPAVKRALRSGRILSIPCIFWEEHLSEYWVDEYGDPEPIWLQKIRHLRII